MQHNKRFASFCYHVLQFFFEKSRFVDSFTKFLIQHRKKSMGVLHCYMQSIVNTWVVVVSCFFHGSFIMISRNLHLQLSCGNVKTELFKTFRRMLVNAWKYWKKNMSERKTNFIAFSKFAILSPSNVSLMLLLGLIISDIVRKSALLNGFDEFIKALLCQKKWFSSFVFLENFSCCMDALQDFWNHDV